MASLAWEVSLLRPQEKSEKDDFDERAGEGFRCAVEGEDEDEGAGAGTEDWDAVGETMAGTAISETEARREDDCEGDEDALVGERVLDPSRSLKRGKKLDNPEEGALE